MIHIFHGELVEESRKELVAFKQRFQNDEIVVLEGKKVTMTDLLQAMQSHSLLSSMRVVVVENYLSRFSARKKEDLIAIENVVKAIPDDAQVLFWDDKELGKTILNLFPPKTDRALFKPKRIIFQLVESLAPLPTKTFVELFTQCTHSEGIELTYAMILRQIRLLLLVKSGQAITEIAPWQKSRLAKQAAAFTLSQLLHFYSQFLLIEERVKTGKSALTFEEELRLFLLSGK